MSNQSGLSSEEAKRRLAQYGPNALVEKKRKPAWLIFLSQFNDVMIFVLLAAALISFVLGESSDFALIMIVILLHGILGFIQEYKAEESFAALKKMIVNTTRVWRDGELKLIDVREIVPGDVVLIEAGDRIPADAIFLEGSSFACDEAMLSGESVPVHKKKDDKVFMGTVCVSGKGIIEIEKTGMNTEIGRIAAMVQETEEEKTPLELDFEKLGKSITIGVLALCLVIFAAGWLHGFEPLDMFITSVSLAVAAIPEGLPAVVTIVLAVGVQRMAKRKAIIRKLKAVETLGCTTVIATDKTGTLTRNEMVVKKFFANDRIVEVSGVGYEPRGVFTQDGKNAVLGKEDDLLLRIGVLCNNAYLKESENGEWQIIGDSTEGALVVLGAKADMWKEELMKEYPEIAVFPFDATRKRMTTIHKIGKEKNAKRIAYIKGAPESMLKISKLIFKDGKEKALQSSEKQRLLKLTEEFAAQGYRTIAFGYKELDHAELSVEAVEKDIVFVGIAAMIDAPREEVKASIEKCKSAGIKVIMITGDHPLTAKNIGDQLGISNGKIMTGEELEKMNDEELDKIVDAVGVYARVSPAQKLRIVNSLKRKGHVVAVTGDGVNDAPALKKADIGVAMGITGTDVSKESADMVLSDDNFATIVAAVEEGRGVYDNIKKVVAYLFSGNIVEVAVIFFSIMLGLPLPLLAFQILFINLITDGLPAIALSVEPIEKDVMKRKPRKQNEPIWKDTEVFLIEAPILLTLFCLGMFVYELNYVGDLVRAQTMVFTMLIVGEKLLAFNSRFLNKPSVYELFSNKWLVATAIFTFALQLLILYYEPLAKIFKVVPLRAFDWLILLSLSLVLFGYVEIRKWWKNKKQQDKKQQSINI